MLSSDPVGTSWSVFLALLLSTLAVWSAHASEPVTVVAEQSNIVAIRPSGERLTLTTSGRDRDPVLSPTGDVVAFVREVPDREVSSGSGPAPLTELWVVGLSSNGAQRLVEGRDDGDPRRLIGAIRDLQFSVDGKRIFFLCAAWAVSDALHFVEVETGIERYVTSANRYSVIHEGRHRGHLLVSQHRYHTGGPSFDAEYIYTAEGEELERRRILP